MPSLVVAPRAALLFASLLPVVVAPAGAQNVGAQFSNSVDGYLEVPYSQAIVPQTGITVEAWITYDEATLGAGWRYPTVVRQGLSVNGSENFFLRVNANNNNSRVLRWKIKTASNEVSVDWPFQPGRLLTWTHVAGTYDGNTVALYVDGVLVNSLPGNGQPIRDIGNEVFRIGKGSDVATPIEVWNGQIDEVRLWPFARTQAEIQSTMQQELFGVPGRVSTWNLSGFEVDTSGNQHATLHGQVLYSANPLTLSAPPMAGAFGASSPGCLGDLRLAPAAAASVGNAAFAIALGRTPPAAGTLWGVSLQGLPSALPVFGVDVWIDPTSVVTFGAVANALGSVRLPLAVPVSAPAGFQIAVQAVVVDPCGSQSFTASDALLVTLLP